MTTLEVYADVWCPFAHVGIATTLKRRRELGRDDVALVIRAWPLELVNGIPLDPTSTAEHVEELRDQVAPGLFAGFDPGHFPTSSLRALALGAAAYRAGDSVGEAVGLALRDALFERGLDVSDPDVLAGIARAHGVALPEASDLRDVLDDWHRGEARGVKGSPHFFCGDLGVFCPGLDIARDAELHLQIHRNTEALSAFLERCWGDRRPR